MCQSGHGMAEIAQLDIQGQPQMSSMMLSITHIQSSLYGESEPRVLREGCGYSSYTLGSGLYTP